MQKMFMLHSLYPRYLRDKQYSTPRVMKDVEISKEPVELYTILKFEGMVSSGADAKSVIANGEVMVNGNIETRKRRKIVSGDIIMFGDEIIHIKYAP
jgi:ribosome-associated protein